ncbi:MAG: tripartite tricarboxylate transporter substrate binding protein [Reyranella sp.]|nr:tripartite tricarboxylate transporter substrate binding protein [Reyranella sp.]
MPIRPLRLLLSVLAAFFLPLNVGAQTQGSDYPNKPIRMIIPWAAGGPTDSIGRVLTQKMAEQMGQSFIIENKPGATGTIGHAIAARSAPDGYTVLLASNSTFSIAPHLYKDLSYDTATAFAPVAWVALNAQVLSVHPSLPAKSYAELVALAKAEPGKLNFSTAGVGSTSHLATELLMSMAGIKLTHVPYKGGEPSLQALLAGETKVAFVDLSIAGAQAAAGRLRPLAVSTPKRAELLPDLPTLAEAGLPGFESMTTFAMFAPAGTPPEVIARLNREVNKALATQEVKKWMLGQGIAGVGGPPADLAAHQATDSAKWGKIIKEQGIKFE